MKQILKSIICGMVGVFLLLPLHAQNIIRPKIAGPSGLWVNSYNGVLFFGQTDFETQNSAMPLPLRFYYNSSSTALDYGYGLGFSMGHEMRYEEDEIGGVTIYQGDGRSDHFVKYGDDFDAPAGVFSTLTSPEPGKYILAEKTGEKYYFDDAKYHKITAKEDRYANKTVFTYQDSLLVGIKDAVGHTITLSYTDGLLVKASASFLNGSFTYSYDGLRRLRKRIDPMGNMTLYAYDLQNHLNEITDANGYKTYIAYNSTGMVSRMKTDVTDKSIRYDGDKTVFIDYTAPKNIYSYYRWDDKGRVVEKAGLCCGTQATMEYDENDNVIKRTDANQGVSTYTYDDRGNMLSATDALGKTERYTYETTFTQVTSYQDKNSNTYRFSYDEKGNLTSISGPAGFSNSYTYNDKGWQVTATDANNNVTRTNYNNDGTTESVMDAAGYTQHFSYDAYGNILAATDGRNNTTSYQYDALYRIIQQTDALGKTTTLSYDKVGNVVRIKDAANHITAYSYDAVDNVTTKTDAMGNVTTLTYDGKGNVLSVKNVLGQVAKMAYNERNKLVSQTNPAGETTGYDYDGKGNLVAVFQPNGNTVGYNYDAIDRLVSVSDNMGLLASYTYDGNGNRLSVKDGLGHTVTYTYDGLNRKTSETLPSGSKTSYTYDANSNLLTVADALGNQSQYTYSSLNQQLSHIDALNAKTTFEYDGNGNLVKATDANNNATTWTYDALNHNTNIAFANGTSLAYSYDVLGNVIESEDRAQQATQYAYDALGRLLNKTYADKSQDVFAYNALGQLMNAVNKDATVTFAYDQAGRVLSETLNGKMTSYGYDIAAGKRTYTYPSGMKVEEQLNARDLIVTLLQNGAEAANMSYNVAGQKTAQTYANGITTNYTYNQNGWLEQIADANSILNLKMSYDAIGNITKREDLLNAERTESYSYDAISQLTGFVRGTKVNHTFQFDLLGNRVKVVEDGITTNYSANNVNAYTSVSGGLNFTPSYDGNGNLLNDDKHQFAYDMNNRMVTADAVTFKYDALGRRIAKNDMTYYYVGDQMVEEYKGNTLAASYLYGNNIDETLLMNRNGESYYYTNHLGSTMALTDSKGALKERVDYDVYGKPLFLDAEGKSLEASSVGNNILFTGREYDSEMGVYYYRARSMHPMVGRFMQHDPLMYVDGMNDLGYVSNNSIIKIDPYGLLLLTGGVSYDVCLEYSDPKKNFCERNPEVCEQFPDDVKNIGDALGGPLENYKWGNNGQIYSPKFYGNQYVDIGGKIGNVGKGLGIGATLLSAPNFYNNLKNSNNWSEYLGHIGNFGGSALGGDLGVTGGAALGAAIGTAVFPGVGTFVGGAVGGIAGGYFGSKFGGNVGRYTGQYVGSYIDNL